MSAELDSLIRKSKDLEVQIGQLTAELADLHEAIAQRMGDRREYYGQGLVAKNMDARALGGKQSAPAR